MKFPTPIFLLALLCASSSSASVLVSYSMSHLTTPPIVTPTTSDPSVVATNLTSNNLTISYVPVSGNDVLTAAPGSATANAAATFTAAIYFSFTITPNAGQSLSLSSLTFTAAPGGTSGVTRAFYVASSVEGFSTANVLVTDTTNGGGMSLAAPTYNPYTVDFTSIASSALYQNLTSATTFRFYVQVDGATRTVNFDDIVLNGTVSAIPEPTSAATVTGLAVVVIAACCRRMRIRSSTC